MGAILYSFPATIASATGKSKTNLSASYSTLLEYKIAQLIWRKIDIEEIIYHCIIKLEGKLINFVDVEAITSFALERLEELCDAIKDHEVIGKAHKLFLETVKISDIGPNTNISSNVRNAQRQNVQQLVTDDIWSKKKKKNEQKVEEKEESDHEDEDEDLAPNHSHERKEESEDISGILHYTFTHLNYLKQTHISSSIGINVRFGCFLSTRTI